jgi:hypothetical protein
VKGLVIAERDLRKVRFIRDKIHLRIIEMIMKNGQFISETGKSFEDTFRSPNVTAPFAVLS